VLNGNCRIWSTPEDDGTSRRGWKHLLHPLLRKNWGAFRISSGFNLFPFGSYNTDAIDLSKASLAGEIVSAFATVTALVQPKQGSANFLTLACTALRHDLACLVGFLLCEHSIQVRIFAPFGISYPFQKH